MINLSENFEQDYDDDGNPIGNKIYQGVNSLSFRDLFNKIKESGMPESDYDKIECRSGFHQLYNEDLVISITYKKSKTMEEISTETKELEQKIVEKKKHKEESKKLKDFKKIEKQKVIASLTFDQKKSLGLK